MLEPGDDDVLLGHPHPAPWTVFRRSARQPGWRRVIILAPYNHDPRQVSFVDSLVSRCDLYLAITGGYWFDSIQGSLFSHWAPKMVHVDLAVDRHDFPIIKRRFNPAGSRRFLYIGHSGWQKNVRYLQRIAQMMPRFAFSWMGDGRTDIEGVTRLGHHDFVSDSARSLVASHDFLLSVGKVDANPATILEAMAWGLVPACTPTSGYSGYRGIVNIPLDDPAGAVSVLEGLQYAPEHALQNMQSENWNALDVHFNWNRFASQVRVAIDSGASPPMLREGTGRKARLRVAAVVSPHSMLRRGNLRLLAHRTGLTRPKVPIEGGSRERPPPDDRGEGSPVSSREPRIRRSGARRLPRRR
jgi:glycosyltransferase involved in cell wall biosynthesis